MIRHTPSSTLFPYTTLFRSEQPPARFFPEVTVEVAREDTIERSVGEGKLECIALHEARLRRLLSRDRNHPFACVEPDHVAAEVPREESGAAGNVERGHRR